MGKYKTPLMVRGIVRILNPIYAKMCQWIIKERCHPKDLRFVFENRDEGTCYLFQIVILLGKVMIVT